MSMRRKGACMSNARRLSSYFRLIQVLDGRIVPRVWIDWCSFGRIVDKIRLERSMSKILNQANRLLCPVSGLLS